jgi:hypothetical protein
MTIDNLVITWEQPMDVNGEEESEDSEAPLEEDGLSQRIEVKRMTLEAPNLKIGLEAGVSPLAGRVVLSGIRWQIGDPAMDGLLITIKEGVIVNPEGPWKDFQSWNGQRFSLEEIIAQIASLRVNSSALREILIEQQDHDVVSIDSVKTGRAGIFAIPGQILLSKVRTMLSDQDILTIEEISLSYDLVQPVLELSRNPEREDIKWLLDNPANLDLHLDKIKSTGDGKDIFTVKDVRLGYNSVSSLISSRFDINDFRLSKSWLADNQQALALALRGKPLRLTLQSSSQSKSGGVGPFSLNLNLPDLARLKIEGQLGQSGLLSFDGSGLGDLLQRQMDEYMETLLIKQFSLRYDDESLIDTVLAVMTAPASGIAPGGNLSRQRQEIVNALLAWAETQENGFSRDTLRALSRLIGKPGRFTMSLEAPRPMPVTDIIELLLEGSPASGQIKYKVSAN